MFEDLSEELVNLLAKEPALERAYLVGGCVRDALIGASGKDVDVEVYGVSYEDLCAVLEPHGRVDLVGRSFGVIKLRLKDGETYDFSIPRRDSKIADGHKGFEVTFDPDITLEEAAQRRDFTINSLMWDPREKKIIDLFGGESDLKQGVLRHTSDAFAEDPLRVLRGMQFAGRFDLKGHESTLTLCREIAGDYPQLAVERVREEWFKWASRSKRPSSGLRFLVESGWSIHFPEIDALRGVPQDPEWHPEGDVFVHTCHCCDAMAQLPEWQAEDEESRIAHMFGILSHDFAKPETTHEAERNGRMRIVSPGHEPLGGPVAESFLKRIDAPNTFFKRVPPLVKNHLVHTQPLSEKGVRRLAKRLFPETIEGLCLVVTADLQGRPPKVADLSDVDRLRELASNLNVLDESPQPILLGRHLMDRGMEPGKSFGSILNSAMEAQLEGEFIDLKGAVDWLERYLDSNN